MQNKAMTCANTFVSGYVFDANNKILRRFNETAVALTMSCIGIECRACIWVDSCSETAAQRKRYTHVSPPSPLARNMWPQQFLGPPFVVMLKANQS